MKILHVVPAYHPEGPGGIETHVAGLVREQAARGLQPVVLTGCAATRPRAVVEPGEVDGVRVHRLHRDDLYFHHYAKAYHPGVEERFDRLLADEAPDVLHVHHWLRLTCNLIEIATARAVPAVVTLHDTYASCPRCWRLRPDLTACTRPVGADSCRDCVPRWGCETEDEVDDGIELFRQAYRHELTAARAVLVNARATGELVGRTLGLDAARFRELPFGYQRRLAAPPARAPLPRGREPFRLAHWGNLGRHKGVVELLQAVRRVADGGAAPFELHLFGPVESPALAAELDRLAAGLPVVRHGAFALDDVARLRPHLGVLPSLCFETFSFVLEECFELGLPCIVSDLGAPPRRAGGAALVVPAGDVAALAATIARVLADPGLRDRLAEQVPSPPPSPTRYVEELLRVYATARAAAPPVATAPVSKQQWCRFLARQRDHAQARLCRDGGPA